MRNSLVAFAVITIGYTLMTFAGVWFGLEYDQPDLVERARNLHAFGWTLSYISLAIFLLLDFFTGILKK